MRNATTSTRMVKIIPALSLLMLRVTIASGGILCTPIHTATFGLLVAVTPVRLKTDAVILQRRKDLGVTMQPRQVGVIVQSRPV